jgi:16S rRNA (adenine1518-N6/adenine1519-N6)-dimethyltransferase
VSTTSTGSSSPGSRVSPPPGPPDRPAAVDEALRRLGVRPSRSLGQSFLIDRFVADALAALAEPASGRPVVEIGGGLGIVTRALIDRGVRRLTVVERDPRLARHLRTTFGGSIEVQEEDARGYVAPEGATVVGSLPYSAATPILLGLLAQRVPRIAVLLQKEVAERLAAGPGGRTYGRPSILAHLYGEPELLREVGPEAFHPRPRVKSRLWAHTARSGPLPVASVPHLEEVVRRLFASRRKQLGNLLPTLAGGTFEAERLATDAGWPAGWSRSRPEQLPPEAFFRLADLWRSSTPAPHRSTGPDEPSVRPDAAARGSSHPRKAYPTSREDYTG